jgi:hypothetical protein
LEKERKYDIKNTSLPDLELLECNRNTKTTRHRKTSVYLAKKYLNALEKTLENTISKTSIYLALNY